MARVARVDLPLDELLARILGYCGKDSAKVSSILSRGTLVSGDTRYRWTPIQADESELADTLNRFPDHEPGRSFDGTRCYRMVFRGTRGDFEITREAAVQRRLFRRKSFWDEALTVVESLMPRCERYSYPDATDVFSADLTADARDRLREFASLLRFSALEAQVRTLPSGRARLFVRRPDAQRQQA